MATIEWGTNSPAAFDSASAWVGGVAPSASDDAVFTGEFNGNCLVPGTPPDTVANIYVSKQYTGSFGTSGSPVQVNCSTIDYAGSGAEAFFTSTCDIVNCRSTALGSNALVLNVTASGLGDAVNVISGNVTIQGSSSINYLNIGGNSSRPIVTVQGSAAVNADVVIDDGTVTFDGAGGGNRVSVRNGSVTYKDTGPTNVIQSGGRIQIQGTTDVSITDAFIIAGMFDISAIKAGFTINNGQFVVLPRASANLDPGRAITLSGTAVVIVFQGGQLKSFANTLTPIRV